MSYLSREQIEAMGFASLGHDVSISSKTSLYGVEYISIGNHVRIDDYCVISASNSGVKIGNHVHIAVGCTLIGAGLITLSDFSGLSSRVAIYSSSDDYSGEFLTNPTVPTKFTNVRHADVFFGKHVIVGSGSVILPGSILEEGVAVGALSLIKKNCQAFGIYHGNPVRRIGERQLNLLELEMRLTQEDL